MCVENFSSRRFSAPDAMRPACRGAQQMICGAHALARYDTFTRRNTNSCLNELSPRR
jgi:hypothetical protein